MTYIAGHVTKAFKDPGARTGTLHAHSPMESESVNINLVKSPLLR